jgi:hypothetical protein
MNKLMLVVLCTGCSSVDSSDILTSGIYAELSASSAGTGTTQVSATLYLGNPINLDFVDLTGDDQLIASHAGQTMVMSETSVLNIVGHNATFATDAEGEEFAIDLQRTVDNGAPESTATLPAKFTLAGPTTPTSRAGTIALTWSPANTADRMSWQATGDCIDLAVGMIPGDTGSFSIPANAIHKKMSAGVVDSCMVTIAVSRTRDGHLDPGYGKGGHITGVQARTISVTSNP